MHSLSLYDLEQQKITLNIGNESYFIRSKTSLHSLLNGTLATSITLGTLASHITLLVVASPPNFEMGKPVEVPTTNQRWLSTPQIWYSVRHAAWGIRGTSGRKHGLVDRPGGASNPCKTTQTNLTSSFHVDVCNCHSVMA
jgi:hypothetical protein